MKTQEHNKKRVCVIGAGAAGMMCAVFAAKSGADVTLFEKNTSQKHFLSEEYFDNAYMGKKLLITGKGRCNVTNNCDEDTFLKNVPVNPKFLYAALHEFSTADTIEFFESGGCELKTERGNRVFPKSDKALDILRVLKDRLRQYGVKVINRAVAEIGTADGEFKSVTDSSGNVYEFDAACICTGGISYPVTGSTGDGYRFAENTGHNIKTPKASLVPLTSDDALCADCQGLSLKNVTVSVVDNKKKKKVYSALGEMLFTHYGLSGPLILSASAHMRDIEKDRYKICIDLKPSLDEKTLDNRLLSDFSKYINKDMKNALCDLLPSKLILPFLSYCGIKPDEKPNGITKEQRHTMVRALKDLEIGISGTRPAAEAIITSGGVSVKDVNSSTMESKKIKNLYFAGEVLDVDAYTGGFNLQIAFSTGCLAGKNMGTKENEGYEGYALSF